MKYTRAWSKKALALILLAGVPALTLSGAAPLPLMVVAMADTPPVIDGRLDEAIWANAVKFDAFKTFKPDFGKDASQPTEAYFTYDARNIYFAFRCYDSEPGKVKAAISKRDAIFQDDLVFIMIDTFNDNQSAFVFMLNPLGIQGDGMLTVNGNIDESFDTVWYSKGLIDDKGWTVEARVPLQSIRFPNKDVMTMKVSLVRFFTRTSEQVSFPALDPAKGSILGQAQPIRVTGLKYKRVVEIIPAATSRITEEAQEGEMVRTERTPLRDVPSLTGKLGVTSDLTLDGTYNPDFSQVEADAGQVDVNLRYQLYYPEKRPFFLEGSDLWAFGGAMEDAPLLSLVYTRTIVDPSFGFRLTGKVTPRDTVATLYAKDYRPDSSLAARPDIMIARYRHTLKDDAFIGAFYTGSEYGGSNFNRVGGVDGRFRLSQTQIASFHLFGALTRRPGDEETGKDHALSALYEFSNRKWVVQLGYQDISQNFQVDTGFLARTGVRRINAFGMYQIYPKSKFFQKIEPLYWSYHIYDTFYKMWETMNIFIGRFYLPRNTQVRFEGLLGNEVYSGQRFDRSGYGFRLESQLWKQLFINVNARRMGAILYDPADPLQGWGYRLSAGAAFQPAEKLDFTLSWAYQDFYLTDGGGKVYDFQLLRSRNTFQLNKYLFVRGIVEYNFYYKRLTLDGLLSFTYIPGTVFYVGYGSALAKLEWNEGLGQYDASDRFNEMKRGFFFKVSYLWRF